MAKKLGTTYHLCIHVQTAIDKLVKGENYLDCTPSKALKILTDYRAAGMEYYTGCKREDKTGRCKGHPYYKRKDDATACTKEDSEVKL